MTPSDPARRAVMEDAARERGDWAGLGSWCWLAGIWSADAYANAYADAYAEPIPEDRMRNGLYAVQLSSASRAVLRVGWFRRDGVSDEYDVAWVTPYRGEYTTRLAQVWSEGPKVVPDWTWSPVVESVAHRFHIVPLARLDPELWAKVCPRPHGWGE